MTNSETGKDDRKATTIDIPAEKFGRRKLYDTSKYSKRYEIPVGLLFPKEFIEMLIRKELRKFKIQDKNYNKRILYLERKIRDMEMQRR